MRIYTSGGNTYAWQWQAKEHIVLEGYPDGVFVRYSNCDTMEAPVVQSRRVGDKLIADIPPKLMQVDKDITVYVCNEDGIIHCHFLSVISSPKPSSYIYEPVEVLRYESLAAKIPFNENYEGALLFVQNSVAHPLALGAGLEIRDGALRLKVAAGGEGVAVAVDADGALRVSLDGVEIPMQVDGDGYAYWPGLTATVDADGYIVLERS
jgi:hypothetical protein